MKLGAHALSYRYAVDGPLALDSIDFEAEAGSFWCVAGPNGSGKSTLLKLVSGLLGRNTRVKGASGQAFWDGRPLDSWDRLALSRAIAYVPGGLVTSFPVTVEEFVAQGRYARARAFWSRPTTEDERVATAALAEVGIERLSRSLITRLSSGELQLALIARALAQEPRALLLDESTANLDIRFQGRVFDLLSRLRHSRGVTVLVVCHDLNLAAEFCPQALWLRAGRVFARGPVETTLTRELLDELYSCEGRVEPGRNPFTSRPKVFWRVPT